MNDSPVILVRGAPGSGKTTFAHKTGRVVIEADDYFMIGGLYCFNHAMIADAHKRCLFLTKQAVERGLKVAVANTFSRYWEMKDYLRLWPNAPVFRCVGRWKNCHQVPAHVVERIRARMEPLFGEVFVEEGNELGGDAA